MVRLILILGLLFTIGCNKKPITYSKSKNPEPSPLEECRTICKQKYNTDVDGAVYGDDGHATYCYCE